MSNMTNKLCKMCEITLNYPTNKFPKNIEYKSVSNDKNNDVLVEIMKNKKRLKKNEKFLIIVNESRYGIFIQYSDKSKVILEQNFLHYDSNKMMLVSVYKRLVKILL